jgi:hypothetical protein
MSDTFLDKNELKEFTGRSYVKLQIQALREMGVPFFVNGIGRPVVARAVLSGRSSAIPTPPKKAWKPKVLTAG